MDKPITVTRIDAARRQLNTAIEMWFLGGDPVSTHTLACSAHEVLNDLNRSNNGPPIMFDSPVVKDEHRNDVIKLPKEPMNFFKHADGRRAKKGKKPKPDDTLTLEPTLLVTFIFMGVVAVRSLGLTWNSTENIFVLWCGVHHPNWMSNGWTKVFHNGLPVDKIAMLRAMSRVEFFKGLVESQQAARQASQ